MGVLALGVGMKDNESIHNINLTSISLVSEFQRFSIGTVVVVVVVVVVP
jgi:hypothetical protein